jgi:hypothetical protein
LAAVTVVERAEGHTSVLTPRFINIAFRLS